MESFSDILLYLFSHNHVYLKSTVVGKEVPRGRWPHIYLFSFACSTFISIFINMHNIFLDIQTHTRSVSRTCDSKAIKKKKILYKNRSKHALFSSYGCRNIFTPISSPAVKLGHTGVIRLWNLAEIWWFYIVSDWKTEENMVSRHFTSNISFRKTA